MDTGRPSPAFPQSPGQRPISAGAQGNTDLWVDSTETTALQQLAPRGPLWGARQEVGSVGGGGSGGNPAYSAQE